MDMWCFNEAARGGAVDRRASRVQSSANASFNEAARGGAVDLGRDRTSEAEHLDASMRRPAVGPLIAVVRARIRWCSGALQ